MWKPTHYISFQPDCTTQPLYKNSRGPCLLPRGLWELATIPNVSLCRSGHAWFPLASTDSLQCWGPSCLDPCPSRDGREGGREGGESLENMRKRTIVNFTICQQVILPLLLWWHSKPVKGRLRWLIQESTISSWTYVFFIFWEYIRWAQPTLHPWCQEGSHSYHLPISSPRWRLRSARTRRPQDPVSGFGCGYSLNGDANSEHGFLFKEPQNVSKHRMC